METWVRKKNNQKSILSTSQFRINLSKQEDNRGYKSYIVQSVALWKSISLFPYIVWYHFYPDRIIQSEHFFPCSLR